MHRCVATSSMPFAIPLQKHHFAVNPFAPRQSRSILFARLGIFCGNPAVPLCTKFPTALQFPIFLKILPSRLLILYSECLKCLCRRHNKLCRLFLSKPQKLRMRRCCSAVNARQSRFAPCSRSWSVLTWALFTKLKILIALHFPTKAYALRGPQ